MPGARTGQLFGSRTEEIGQGVIQDVISRSSNLGSDNPFKGPTARSLFYDAASRNPPKYGQFLFYSLGNNDTNFIDAYYRSESSDYNRNVSSLKSKNPSAGFLIRETIDLETLTSVSSNGNLPGLTSNFERSIIGGLSAPYHWKDFLYCKYYGAIPNNYMITLRRFPTPVLDNLSVPEAVKNSESYRKNGAGRPVAQAVTWFGGNTGNNLNSLLSFGSGINWEPRNQDDKVQQIQNSKGFFGDLPFKWLTKAASGLNGNLGNFMQGGADFIEKTAIAFDPLNETVDNLKAYGLRDRAKEPRMGVLNEFIWVSVDTVKQTYVRTPGLKFSWESLNVTFEYELTSVGEVNTKAAMLDILGNLLAIGTNYGNFLTPNFRYESNYPALGFPGGDAGLESFYRDPLAWLVTYGNEIVNTTKSSTDNSDQGIVKDEIGAGQTGEGTDQGEVKQLVSEIGKLINEGNLDVEALKKLSGKFKTGLSKLLKLAVTQEFIESWQMPASFLTGAPIGEWHLVIGNPCNPIAMIGNLICTDVNISFTEQLGPDDFPTGIKATFTLKHARDRERGEIESIFNRGDGRLYQTSAETSSDAVSFGAFADTTGQLFSVDRANDILGMDGFFGSMNDQNSPSEDPLGNTSTNLPGLGQ